MKPQKERKKEFDDDYLRELFSRDVPISEETNAKIQEVYDEIRKNGSKMRRSPSHHHISINKRLISLIAAVSLLLSFSISAFALEIPYFDFFASVFGNEGIGSTEEHSHPFAPNVILPKNERISVDPDMAEQLVGDYINPLDKKVNLFDYDFTLENGLMDENGIGYITYWVENPNGLDSLQEAGYNAVYFALDNGLGVCDPDIFSDGTSRFASYNFRDKRLSSHTKAYLILTITPVSSFSDTDKLTMQFSGFEENKENPNEEDEPTYVTKEVPISLKKKLPCVSYSDFYGNFSAEISAIGIHITAHRQKKLNDSAIKHRLIINYVNGEKYTVIDFDKNIENNWQGSLYQNCENYIFNRIVNIDEVESITIDNVTLIANNK